VTPLSDTIPDEIGAQLLINTATALTAIRTAHESVPPDSRAGVVVLLTAAGSAVGRLLGKLLTDRGVKVIRLVRSEVGAEKLAELLPGSPIFATDAAGWKERARAAAEGAKIHVAIDSVGGALLGDVADLLAEGPGRSSISAHLAARRAISGCLRPAPSRSGVCSSGSGYSSRPTCAKLILPSPSGSRSSPSHCSRSQRATRHRDRRRSRACGPVRPEWRGSLDFTGERGAAS